ncbi:hypothetical protein [Rhodopseudomonas sp.]|uniref:hypothetical protein n=1 Tax=Rhodopseudomonas sp. TaxID=1078 RepID=UPI003B3B1EE6
MGAGLRFFAQNECLTLQSSDALLVGLDDGSRSGFDDAVEQLLHLPLNLLRFTLAGRCQRMALRQPLLPSLFEHPVSGLHQRLARADARKNTGEFAFDHIAFDRFSILFAGLLEEHVIRMLHAGLTRGPA